MASISVANLPGSSQSAGDKYPQHVLIVNSSGTAIESFGGSGGTASADGTAFTANTTQGTPTMGVYEATPTTLTDGDLGVVGLTANREVKVSVTSGGTSGTQYTEGDTDVSITGTAVMFEGNTGTSALSVVSASAPLPVTLANTGANATAVKVDGSAVTQPVSGTVTANAGTGTFAVSAASLPLPTGAATAAKQPALGTAGTASADVITIQGIASMTAVKVDGSGVTQPVSGTVTVQDGGGALTVDGTVAATQSGTWTVRAADGTGNALTSKVAGAEQALSVAIVDGSGTHITSFGGGTQYTEGDIDASITGTAMLWEDTSDTLRAVSAAKPLPVAIISGAGSGGTASTDDAAFTVASGSGTPIMGLADETTPDSVDEGDVGVVRMTLARGLHVNLRDASGTAITTLPVSLASVPSHDVTNAGTFAVQAAQSGTWNVTNVSGTVSLPTGAATAAKQPALGTAGTPSADVITVQGITSMTALKVDGSAVTQPVSGTVTANLAAGTNNIGDVDVLSVPSDPFGANADAASATGSISAKLRFIASTGIPITGTVTVGSHAVTNAGTFAVQDSEKLADNAAFTDGTTKVNPVGFIYDEVAGTALTENDIAAARITANRAQVAVLEDGTTRGRYATVSAANALKVDGSAVTQPVSNAGTFAVQESGAALTALQLIDDAVFTDDAAFTVATSKGLAIGALADDTSPDSVNEGDFGVLRMTLARALRVAQTADSAALANVASSATSVTLQAANTARVGLIVFNDSTQVLYLKYGATASSTSFTYKLGPGATWEMPMPAYRGVVDGIWASANGNARVTELT